MTHPANAKNFTQTNNIYVLTNKPTAPHKQESSRCFIESRSMPSYKNNINAPKTCIPYLNCNLMHENIQEFYMSERREMCKLNT